MYNSKITTWAAQNLDVGRRTQFLRELPGFVGISASAVSNHWNGRSKVRPELAQRYVDYLVSKGHTVSIDDLFSPVPIPEHA